MTMVERPRPVTDLPPLDPGMQRTVTSFVWRARLRFAASLAYWLLVIGALGWLFSQIIDRAAPVRVLSAELLTPEVKAGGELKVRYKVVRDRLCETTSWFTVVDGRGESRQFGPTFYVSPGKLGPAEYITLFPMPITLAPGYARHRLVVAWECPGNYLHPIYPVTMVFDDLFFTIAPP